MALDPAVLPKPHDPGRESRCSCTQQLVTTELKLPREFSASQFHQPELKLSKLSVLSKSSACIGTFFILFQQGLHGFAEPHRVGAGRLRRVALGARNAAAVLDPTHAAGGIASVKQHLAAKKSVLKR